MIAGQILARRGLCSCLNLSMMWLEHDCKGLNDVYPCVDVLRSLNFAVWYSCLPRTPTSTALSHNDTRVPHTPVNTQTHTTRQQSTPFSPFNHSESSNQTPDDPPEQTEETPPGKRPPNASRQQKLLHRFSFPLLVQVLPETGRPSRPSWLASPVSSSFWPLRPDKTLTEKK